MNKERKYHILNQDYKMNYENKIAIFLCHRDQKGKKIRSEMKNKTQIEAM